MTFRSYCWPKGPATNWTLDGTLFSELRIPPLSISRYPSTRSPDIYGKLSLCPIKVWASPVSSMKLPEEMTRSLMREALVTPLLCAFSRMSLVLSPGDLSLLINGFQLFKSYVRTANRSNDQGSFGATFLSFLRFLFIRPFYWLKHLIADHNKDSVLS